MPAAIATKDCCYVNLNYREDRCCICGMLTSTRQGVPMYEDIVLPNDWDGEWYGRTACLPCFELQGEITKWLPMTAHEFVKIRGVSAEAG